MSCLIIFLAICLFAILIWFLLSFAVFGAAATQKLNRKKIRETADQVISGERHMEISEINKLIDGLDRYYRGNLISRSEDDLGRINKPRAIRNDI
ncbi:hypothetical protein KA005_00170 [bacterium]|nr:hypothetical protein [bacterium]